MAVEKETEKGQDREGLGEVFEDTETKEYTEGKRTYTKK